MSLRKCCCFLGGSNLARVGHRVWVFAKGDALTGWRGGFETDRDESQSLGRAVSVHLVRATASYGACRCRDQLPKRHQTLTLTASPSTRTS